MPRKQGRGNREQQGKRPANVAANAPAKNTLETTAPVEPGDAQVGISGAPDAPDAVASGEQTGTTAATEWPAAPDGSNTPEQAHATTPSMGENPSTTPELTGPAGEAVVPAGAGAAPETSSSTAVAESPSTQEAREPAPAATATATATLEPPTTVTTAVEIQLARLEEIRARVMPILEAVKAEYSRRVRVGFPTLVDNVQRGGVFGINFDSGFGVYFMIEGHDIVAEIHTTRQRTDTLSMANVEKFGGRPNIERQVIDDSWTDLRYRNVIAQMISRWNYLNTRVYRTDS